MNCPLKIAVLQLYFLRLCRQFETTLGQVRLHMLARILNITYDDTPSTQWRLYRDRLLAACVRGVYIAIVYRSIAMLK